VDRAPWADFGPVRFAELRQQPITGGNDVGEHRRISVRAFAGQAASTARLV